MLNAIGLLPLIQQFRSEHHRQFRQFKRRYGERLQYNFTSASQERKIALIANSYVPEVIIELGLIKALELAGFVPVVLNRHEGPLLASYYSLAAVKEVHQWSAFVEPVDVPAAEAAMAQCHSVQELMRFEYEGARVGRFAISTALRHHRLGCLDLQLPEERQILVRYVAAGMAQVKAAQRILQTFRPALVLFVDTGYTPKGELFDVCLAQGIEAIEWGLAHKHSTLMLKRYTLDNRDEHLSSLSPESWRLVRRMEWTAVHRKQLQQELYGNYASGEWYSVAGTQFNKRFMEADSVRQQLGLDPTKKTAFIFPHILWDAALFWGTCLFHDFAEWLIETVRAACANEAVNWVIKIHPAHVGKSAREGFRGEPAEVTILRQHLDALPRHIFIIPADSDMSTLSLFALMDYCLTVRGTVGIEAARLGIPVLTAGTGRYDHRGFTIDSESRQQYLDRLAHIQDIPRLSPAQRELAERFAYGLFMLRPLPLTTVALEYHKSLEKSSSEGRVNIKTKEEWYTAADLRAFAQWVTDSKQADFLMPLPSC
jgi:hypothetical protein